MLRTRYGLRSQDRPARIGEVVSNLLENLLLCTAPRHIPLVQVALKVSHASPDPGELLVTQRTNQPTSLKAWIFVLSADLDAVVSHPIYAVEPQALGICIVLPELVSLGLPDSLAHSLSILLLDLRRQRHSASLPHTPPRDSATVEGGAMGRTPAC